MSDIINEAKKYWENNFNCSQAAACGILDYYGFKQQSETMKKALLPFEGGIGERSICGSLTGALAGLSTLLHEKGIERDSMYEYKEKSLNYFYIIKRAQTVIEKYYELGLHDNKRVSGAIFALKNMGWYDNQVIDLGLDKLIRLPEVKEEEKHKITSKIKDKI